MNRLWCVVVVSVGMLLAVGAVEAAQKAPALKVQDTERFFTWFFHLKQRVPAKTEFETEEAYRKRLPAIDSQKVLYFLVEPEPDLKNYSYDPSTQALTLGAGTITGDIGMSPYADMGKTTTGQLANSGLRLARQGISSGSYVGETAFGVRRRVSQSVRTDYVLYVSAPREWWEAHAKAEPSYLPARLTVDLHLEPRAADRLSKSYQMLVGVQVKGLAFSSLRVDSGNGYDTTTSPEELTYRTMMISATLKEIIIRDRFTKATVKTVTVPDLFQ